MLRCNPKKGNRRFFVFFWVRVCYDDRGAHHFLFSDELMTSPAQELILKGEKKNKKLPYGM